MASKKLSPVGVGVVVAITVISVSLGRELNPFETSGSRIVYSGIIGGISAGIGVLVAHLLGLVKLIEDEE